MRDKDEIKNMNRDDLFKFYEDNFDKIAKVLYENDDILETILDQLAE